MFAQWFFDNITQNSVSLVIDGLTITIYPYAFFGVLMFCLFLWAAFHLITDVIMAFRSMFGLGNKKKKGGS